MQHYDNSDNMTSVIPNTRILYKQFSKPNKTIIAMYGSCQCDHHYHSTNTNTLTLTLPFLAFVII